MSFFLEAHLHLLFCMETEVSEWESDWGVWHRDMVTIQQSVADYLSEAPEKIGIWYPRMLVAEC